MLSPSGYESSLDRAIEAKEPAQQSLRDRQLRILFETALDAIAITDDQGRYLNVNPAACELFGLEKDELLERYICEFAEPGFNFIQIWQEFSQQEKVRGEFRLVRTDGEIRVVEYAATANYLPNCHLLVMRDITQYKKAQAKVEELTDQLTQTQAQQKEAGIEPASIAIPTESNCLEQIGCHIPGVIYQFRMRLDGTFHFPYASEGLREVYGVSPEEVRSDASKVFTIIHPEDFDRVSQSILESAKYLTPWYCEYRVCFPDGRVLWLLGHSTPQRQADGSTIWHGYIRDITDIKATELALRKSENKFRSIIENLNDLVYIINPDRSFSYVSPQFKEVMGYELADFLDRSFAQWIYPEDLSICVDAVDRSLQGEKLRGIEYRVLHQDGNYYWHSSNLSALRDDDGQVIACLGIARYIHDRKEAEKNLRQNEQKYHQILDAITDMVLVKGPKSRIVWANKAFRDYYGLSNEQLKDMIDAPFNEPDYTLQYIKDDAYVFETGQSLEIEEPVTRYDGKVHIFNTIKSVIRNEAGEKILTVGVCRNITDRKRAEAELNQTQAELKEAEKFLRSIYEGVGCLIFVVDVVENKEFLYSGWSLSTEKAIGIKAADITGKTPEAIFGLNEGTAVRQNLLRCIESGTSITYEECLTFNNRETWWLTTLSSIKNSDNRISRIVGTTIDISDRKRQEQALLLIIEGTAAKTGEAFFKSCVQYLAQVLEVRYASIAEFADAEKSSAKILAFWAGEDFGENFTYNLAGTPCQKVASNTEVCRYQNSVQCLFPKDGDLVTLQAESYAGLSILDSAGNHLGLLAVLDTKPMVKDLEMQSAILKIFATRAGAELERIQAEAAVRQSEIQLRQQTQELEITLKKLQNTQSQLIQAEKMSSLGQLVAGVAHEINNPVSFIYSNIQPATDYANDLIELIHLYREHYPNPPQAIVELIENIEFEYLVSDFSNLLDSMKNGATRIGDIVKSLRTFSRLDEADFKEIDIHENIESTLVILQNRLNGRSGRREIHLTKNYGKLPPIECYGGLLNQVFMNLLVNAIDAIEQRRQSLETTEKLDYIGIITITTSITCENQVLISIHDNGCGMNPQVQEKIFNPFFTTKPVGKGTGMGLAISYQIITENHQGKLQCFSTVGKGTEFRIELPISK